MSDIGDALNIYRAIGGTEADGTEHAAICIIPGAPVSKSRVRFGKGHAYNRPEAVAAERKTATYVRGALHGHVYPGNVALGCIFYRPNFQRIDTDNLLKHVCDSINGVAFKDDSQVTAIFGRLELDRQNPRTVVVLGPHRSTLVRGVNDAKPCATCGKSVRWKPRQTRDDPRYCSRECVLAARQVELSEPIPCPSCGTPFRRRTSAQKLCSSHCRANMMRDAKKSPKRTLSSCATCGKQLAHARGGRCRECWRANAAINKEAS